MVKNYKFTKKEDTLVSCCLTVVQKAMGEDKNKLDELIQLISDKLKHSAKLNIGSASGIILLDGVQWHSFETFGNSDIIITGFEEEIIMPIRMGEIASLIFDQIFEDYIAFLTKTCD